MFDAMDWGEITTDRVEETLDHFGGLRSASDTGVCELIQVLDCRQAWMKDGARSLAEWISVRLRVRSETAGRLVRVARRLNDLPLISRRFAAGDLSLDQVDALSRIATAETEAELLVEALGLNNAQLDRLARRAHPPSKEDAEDVYRRRAAFLQWNLDESEMRLNARMPGEQGQLVAQAMEEAADQIGVNPETGLFDPYPQRLVDGLVEICATTGDETNTPPQMTVHADLDALTATDEGVTELASGALVPNDVARYLSCDCVLETVISNGTQVIGVGRNSRTVPGWLRRLVLHRDGNQCRFPGCGNRRWLQVHHRVHWAHGGTTDLDNLITLCGHHHRFIHTNHWTITLTDGQFVFRKPDRTVYPKAKPELHPTLANLIRPTQRQ